MELKKSELIYTVSEKWKIAVTAAASYRVSEGGIICILKRSVEQHYSMMGKCDHAVTETSYYLTIRLLNLKRYVFKFIT